LASQHPDIVAKFQARMKEIEKTLFNPDRGTPDPAACKASEEKWDNFRGPWVYL